MAFSVSRIFVLFSSPERPFDLSVTAIGGPGLVAGIKRRISGRFGWERVWSAGEILNVGSSQREFGGPLLFIRWTGLGATRAEIVLEENGEVFHTEQMTGDGTALVSSPEGDLMLVGGLIGGLYVGRNIWQKRRR